HRPSNDGVFQGKLPEFPIASGQKFPFIGYPSQFGDVLFIADHSPNHAEERRNQQEPFLKHGYPPFIRDLSDLFSKNPLRRRNSISSNGQGKENKRRRRASQRLKGHRPKHTANRCRSATAGPVPSDARKKRPIA